MYMYVQHTRCCKLVENLNFPSSIFFYLISHRIRSLVKLLFQLSQQHWPIKTGYHFAVQWVSAVLQTNCLIWFLMNFDRILCCLLCFCICFIGGPYRSFIRRSTGFVSQYVFAFIKQNIGLTDFEICCVKICLQALSCTARRFLGEIMRLGLIKQRSYVNLWIEAFCRTWKTNKHTRFSWYKHSSLALPACNAISLRFGTCAFVAWKKTPELNFVIYSKNEQPIISRRSVYSVFSCSCQSVKALPCSGEYLQRVNNYSQRWWFMGGSGLRDDIIATCPLQFLFKRRPLSLHCPKLVFKQSFSHIFHVNLVFAKLSSFVWFRLNVEQQMSSSDRYSRRETQRQCRRRVVVCISLGSSLALVTPTQPSPAKLAHLSLFDKPLINPYFITFPRCSSAAIRLALLISQLLAASRSHHSRRSQLRHFKAFAELINIFKNRITELLNQWTTKTCIYLLAWVE